MAIWDQINGFREGSRIHHGQFLICVKNPGGSLD